VWSDTLSRADPRRVQVVAEDLAELRVVEPLALDADEAGLLGQRGARCVVVGEERD
jgi:hypothetical protein